jgi:hypothetical protein
VCGIVAALLLVADLATLASSPKVGAPAQEIAAHVEANSTLIAAMSYMGALTAVLLLPFLASLRTFVQSGGREGEWRWTVTLLSGVVAVAVVLVGSGLRGAAAVVARAEADAVGVSPLFQAAKVALSFALVPLAAVVATNARTMSTTRVVVRSAIQFGPVLAVLCLVSGAAIFVDSQWFGPGEPVVALVGLLLALWVVATSAAMFEGATNPS